jgi:hypothetical protein
VIPILSVELVHIEDFEQENIRIMKKTDCFRKSALAFEGSPYRTAFDISVKRLYKRRSN